MAKRVRVVITGVSSGIMGELVRRMDRNRYRITGITRHSKQIAEDMDSVVGDLRDLNVLEKALRDCDILIHAAGVTHSLRPEAYMEVNYRVTKRMVEMANALHIQNVVFISSRAAGPRCGAYGASKFLAEQCVKGSTGNWLILRLAEVFGGSKLVGIDDLIHKALNRRLLLYPQGLKSKLYPIYTQDVAAIVNDLVFEKGIINRVITINGNTGYSYKEIIQLAGRICGKSILAAPIPKPLLFALKAVIEKTALNVGMAPDQVDRLYCEKQTEHLGYNLLSLKTYIERCVVNAHRLTS